MLNPLANKDIVNLICLHLTFDEIYMLGSLNRELRRVLRGNSELWKKFIVNICPNPLWIKFPDNEVNYVDIAINSKTPWDKVKDTLEKELQRQYIIYRLGLPMSNKEALRIFLLIETPGLPSPHNRVTIPGRLEIDDDIVNKFNAKLRKENIKVVAEEEEPDEWRLKYGIKSSTDSLSLSNSGTTALNAQNSELEKKKPKTFLSDRDKDSCFKIVFERADGKTIYRWKGEAGIQSTHKIYVLDRLQSGSFNVTTAPNFESYVRKEWSITVLSTKNCNEIYELVGKHIPTENSGIIKPKEDETPQAQVRNGRADRLLFHFGSFTNKKAEPDVENYTNFILYPCFKDWFQILSKNIPGYLEAMKIINIKEDDIP